MENQTEKVFINGLISKDVADTAPEWILGKMSINTNELINWLTQNRKLGDENGWINLTVKRSQKTNKRYIEVDTWKPKAQEVMPTLVTTPATYPQSVTTGGYNPSTGEVNVSDIPF